MSRDCQPTPDWAALKCMHPWMSDSMGLEGGGCRQTANPPATPWNPIWEGSVPEPAHTSQGWWGGERAGAQTHSVALFDVLLGGPWGP